MSYLDHQVGRRSRSSDTFTPPHYPNIHSFHSSNPWVSLCHFLNAYSFLSLLTPHKLSDYIRFLPFAAIFGVATVAVALGACVCMILLFEYAESKVLVTC
jgi:hypothetical protein